MRNPVFKRPSVNIFLGAEFSDNEITSLQNEVNSLKSTLQNAILEYGFIKQKLVDEVVDLPKLSSYERASYKQLGNTIQRTQRLLNEKEPVLKVMLSSKNGWPTQPTLEDVMSYSVEKNLAPSVAADEFEKIYFYLFYPYSCHAKAEELNRYEKRMINNSEPWNPLSAKWLDKAVEWDDKNFGNGLTPTLDRVLYNRLQYATLKAKIKDFETTYIIDAVNNFLGNPTTLFTKDSIAAITGNDSTIEDFPVKRIEVPVMTFEGQDQNLGGLFKFVKGVVKVALTPVQKLVVSPFNKVMSGAIAPILKTVLPDRLIDACAGLTEAQANMLAGQVSTANVRKSVKAAVTITGYASQLPAQAVKTQISIVKATPVGNSLDKYSGGLLTSADNLANVSKDMREGNKIDVMARTLDGVKIGLAVASGGAAVGAMTATNAAMDKTPLSKIPLGGSIVKGSIAVATGSGVSEVASSLAKEQAIKQGTKIAVSQGLVNQSQGNVLSSVATSYSSGNDLTTALTETGKSLAVSEAKEQAVKSGLVSSSVANLVERGLQTDLANDDLSLLAQDEAKRVVSKQVNNQLARYGVSLDMINKLSEGDLSSLQNNISKMTETDFRSYVQDQQAELQNKFDSARLTMEKKINDNVIQYQNEYERLMKEYTSPALENKLEVLQKKYSDIAKGYVTTLENEMNRISKDFKDGLDKTGKAISNFDPSKIINDALARAKNALSNTGSLFEFNAYDKLYNLTKKYGKDFLLYLMFMYGSRAEYESVIKDSDYENFKTWTPNGIQIKKASSAPLFIGAGIVGAIFLIAGATNE